MGCVNERHPAPFRASHKVVDYGECSGRRELSLVPLFELRPFRRVVLVPLSQLRRRRDVFFPRVNVRTRFRDAARPQPVYQHTIAVGVGGRFVGPLGDYHLTRILARIPSRSTATNIKRHRTEAKGLDRGKVPACSIRDHHQIHFEDYNIMAKNSTSETAQETPVTREQLIQGLQDDIAREYKAIIQYVIFSQKLDGAQYMNIADQLEEHAHQELDHALAIARQLDYFGAYPTHEPKPIEVSEDNEGMLRADLHAEDDTIKHYRERIRQAEAMGEFALSETLRAIIVQEQEHEIDLSSALGINVPLPKTP